VKEEIFCEGETLGGEISLLFIVLFILFNKNLSFLSYLYSLFSAVYE